MCPVPVDPRLEDPKPTRVQSLHAVEVNFVWFIYIYIFFTFSTILVLLGGLMKKKFGCEKKKIN